MTAGATAELSDQAEQGGERVRRRFEQTRVLIVEDHELVARSLVLVLRSEGLIADVALQPSHEEILGAAHHFRPDVVILDYDLGPAGPGTALIAPLIDLGAVVVILTGEGRSHILGECLEAGAVGIVSKAAPIDAVLEAVADAASSGQAMPDSDRQDILSDLREYRATRRAETWLFEQLTPREEAVLIGLGEGLAATEMAERDCVSVWTIRGHIRSILAKLGVGSQLAAVAKARAAGWF